MDANERQKLRARIRALDISLTVFARDADMKRSRVYGFFATGQPELTPAELRRGMAVLAQYEQFRQIVGVGVGAA
jgi:hypothetical protein